MTEERTVGIADRQDLGALSRWGATSVEQTARSLVTGFSRALDHLSPSAFIPVVIDDIRSGSLAPKLAARFSRAVFGTALVVPAKIRRRFAPRTRRAIFTVERRAGERVFVVVLDASNLATRNPAITDVLARAVIRALEHRGTHMTEDVVKIGIRETRGKIRLEFADSWIMLRASRLDRMIRPYEGALTSCASNSTAAYTAKRKLMRELEDVLYWESERAAQTGL